MAGPVHYEIYVRKTPGAPWTLDCAVEERARVTEIADQLMNERGCAAVKATKETFDVESGRFGSLTLFAKGAVELKKEGKTPVEDVGPLCLTPQDLYSAHARERVARLMAPWLKRKAVTGFELLHSADLVEELEASGIEIQHALQKVAIPEAQARGLSVHEVIRQLQGLVDRAIARVRKDARHFPQVSAAGYAREAERLTDHPEAVYMLGGGVARFIGEVKGWRAKGERLIQLAENAPRTGRARALALRVLEPPLSEILGAAGGLGELFGADLDLGGALAALTCLAAPREADAIRRMDASVAEALPPLTAEAQRLAALMDLEAFDGVRVALGKRVVEELNGPRRLRADDAEAEIVLLRALAMVLTASAGRLLPLEDVQAAFVERSKRLVASDFVSAFLGELGPEVGALEEVRALVRLSENVVGAVNKKSAARWLQTSIETLRFEKDVRAVKDGPAARLAVLADVHRGLGQVGFAPKEAAELQGRIGDAGGWVEADSRITALLGASKGPLPARCSALAAMAAGDAAPFGPAADRARAELTRLLRDPEARAALATSPDVAARIRDALTMRPAAAAA